MIKTTAIMLQELNNYKNPRDKLAHMVKKKECIPVIQGLYETNPTTPGYRLANTICSPSYLSFEFALSYHGLIPEAVYTGIVALLIYKILLEVDIRIRDGEKRSMF